MAKDPGALITVREAAKELGLSPTTAYRLVAGRQIPTLRLRGRVRVPRAALHQWLESRSREALAGVQETKPRRRRSRGPSLPQAHSE